MFTGIVEETGEAIILRRHEKGGELMVRGRVVSPGTKAGDSLAVNGCCLTVTRIERDILAFDLLEETLRRTNLGRIEPGSRVNLERSLAADGRIGGHFVQGHIDCAAEVVSFEQQDNDHRLDMDLQVDFARYVAFKGSIAVNGVSLTVAEVNATSFAVWLIPHTIGVTNLGALSAGARVNLEFDILGKYVERMLENRVSPAAH